MKPTTSNATRTYFIIMAVYWLVFGLITTFQPALMDMFQTEVGINAKTLYSNHIWRHDGFDIISISVLLFALSRQPVSRSLLLAAAIVALLVSVAIFLSLVTTSYWNPLFIVPGVGCLCFTVWGIILLLKQGRAV
jgi:hypothetical protein